MPGIDNMLRQIRLSGEEAVKSLREADRSHADAILEKAAQEAEAEYGALMLAARREADKRLALAASARETDASRELLAAKTAAVDSAIALAKEKLASMDEKAYFAALAELIVKSSPRGDCELLLSSRDAERLPADFLPSLNSRLSPDAALTLAPDRAGIDGGCIVRRGLIEENLSFEAILRDRSELIRDRAAAVLFSGPPASQGLDGVSFG